MKSNNARVFCKYICERCDHRFASMNPGVRKCEKCGHSYVKWVNAQEYLLSTQKKEEDE
jgi:hypothetical protein